MLAKRKALILPLEQACGSVPLEGRVGIGTLLLQPQIIPVVPRVMLDQTPIELPLLIIRAIIQITQTATTQPALMGPPQLLQWLPG